MPVIQHFLFGSLLPCTWEPSPVPAVNPVAVNSFGGRAPWAKGAPAPPDVRVVTGVAPHKKIETISMQADILYPGITSGRFVLRRVLCFFCFAAPLAVVVTQTCVYPLCVARTKKRAHSVKPISQARGV